MLKNIKSIISKLKSTRLWYNFLLYFFLPIFNFIWEFILNLEGKIYYLLWGTQRRQFFNLLNNDKLLVKDNPEFQKIAKDLKNYINEDLQNREIKKFKENLDFEKLNNKFEDYRVNLFDVLPNDLKHKIIEFALDEKNLTTAANHLKVFPVIGKIYLFLNFPVKEKNERGAMLWHKDDFGYKSLDLFLAVNEIDEENGPLYFLKQREPLGVFYKLKNIVKNALPGERNKVNINTFSKFFSEDKIDSLRGPAGNAVFVDSFTTYHRGGYCLSKNRIILRICYQTPDSIDVQNKISEKDFYFFKDIKKENIKNKYHKYLLFKKLNSFWKVIRLPNALMSLYRIFHYKA